MAHLTSTRLRCKKEKPGFARFFLPGINGSDVALMRVLLLLPRLIHDPCPEVKVFRGIAGHELFQHMNSEICGPAKGMPCLPSGLAILFRMDGTSRYKPMVLREASLGVAI